MSDTQRAQLAWRRHLGGALWLVGLSVEEPLLRAFHAAGQYQSLRVGEGFEAPFALASAPGRQPFEYLVRDAGDAARALLTLPIGAPVSAGLPRGPGFPVTQARGAPLLLVGTGTGLGPLRAVLQQVTAARADHGPTTLVWGVRSEAELVLADERAAWEAAGVSVVPTVSAPSAGWTGRRGRVQAHLPPVSAAHRVFVCGQHELLGELRELLAQRGVPADHVHGNI